MIGTSGPTPGLRGFELDRRRALRLQPPATEGSGRSGAGGATNEPAYLFGTGEPANDLDLDELVRALVRGRGQLLLITGERGMGRSRRAMSILDRARSVSDVAVIGQHAGPGSRFGQPGDVEVGADRPADGGEGRGEAQGAPGDGDDGDVDGGGGDDGDVALPGPAAFSTSAPGCLVRAIARTRPDGPAARLLAEAREDPRLLVGMAEELALVLVAEAVRRPITVLLEDIHLADAGTHAFVDHLLTVAETVPLLVVVTAATGWAANGAGVRRWLGWIGQHAVLHLPVAPPSRAELVAALGQVCRQRISAQALDGILTASRGNPRIAQELALWTLDGCRVESVPVTCLVRELVAAHDEDGILGVLAVAGGPVGIRLIASAALTSATRVREVLDRAASAGLVDRRSVTGSGDTYELAHSMYAAAAHGLVPPDRVPTVHLAISSALMNELGDDPASALDIARHLVASGHPRTDTATWCLRAATWCESTNRLSDATQFAHAGLDADPDLATRMEIVRVLTRCYRRLGEPRSAAGVLCAALRMASGQPHHSVQIAVELLELRDTVTVQGAEGMLADASGSCPPERPDLVVRLAAVEAAITFRRDPAAGRRAADRAVRAAESVEDVTARVRSLTVAASTLMDPAYLGELERVGAQLMRQPVVDGLAAAAAAALAEADRARLDSVVREYTWRESQWPDQVTRDELTLIRAVVAAMEGRKPVLAQAMMSLSTSTTTRVALQASLLPMVWAVNTRGAITAPGPDITDLPGAEAMADLQWLGHLLSRSTPLQPLEADLLRLRLGGPADLGRPRADGTWAARLAAAATFGTASRDRELCAMTVRALGPFLDQFVVVWPFIPVGPVGWFLAGALRTLGKDHEAASALAAAQAASENLGAPGWTLRIAAERSRLLSAGVAPVANDLVQATVGPVLVRRFPGVVAEIRCRVGDQLAGGDPRSRSRSAGPRSPDLVAGGPVAGAPVAGGPVAGGPVAGAPVAGAPVVGGRGAGGPVAGGRSVGRPGDGPGTIPALTAREADIMALAATGCTNQEIAKRLYLSVATVERHCTNLYRRLGVRNRAQALGILGRFGFPGDRR